MYKQDNARLLALCVGPGWCHRGTLAPPLVPHSSDFSMPHALPVFD